MVIEAMAVFYNNNSCYGSNNINSMLHGRIEKMRVIRLKKHSIEAGLGLIVKLPYIIYKTSKRAYVLYYKGFFSYGIK